MADFRLLRTHFFLVHPVVILYTYLNHFDCLIRWIKKGQKEHEYLQTVDYHHHREEDCHNPPDHLRVEVLSVECGDLARHHG